MKKEKNVKHPKLSPYNLRQEIYRDDPWKMLVICIMLNQTSFRQVDMVRDQFFIRFPDARSMVNADADEVASMIKPLGLQNMRSKKLIRFSKEWMNWDRNELSSLHGIGEYALHSWMIFQEHDGSVEPNDKVLIKYMEWAKRENIFQQESL